MAGQAASALGEAAGGASGAAGLITAIGTLLPSSSTSKGHTETKAKANSDTRSGELNVGMNSTIGTENFLESGNSKSSIIGGSSEAGTNRSSNISSGRSNESFSGQSNSTTTQTMLTEEGAMRIVNMMLQGNGGITGLQETVSGERNAGMFNSSTNSLMTSNLASTIAGEVARLSAPTVQTQNLGATNTQTASTTSNFMDAVTTAINNMNQASSGSESRSGQSNSTQDVLNMVIGLAQQLTDQSSESVTDNKTKTKSGKCGVMAITSILMLPSALTELDTVRNFRDTYLASYYPEAIVEYYDQTTPRVKALEALDVDSQYKFAKELYTGYYMPIVVAHKLGNNELAYRRYLTFLAKFDSIRGA